MTATNNITKTIYAVGDVNPCRDLARSLLAHNIEEKRRELAKLFTGADLVVGNLEGPITDSQQLRAEQIWNLNVPTTLTPLLTPFDGFTLANNHIFDFGEQGYLDTINALTTQNIQYCGAGRNEQEAARPALFDLDGFTVAMIGITDRNWHPCGTETPGAAIWDDKKTTAMIQHLVQTTDFVIVQIHQGYEFIDYPGPEEIEVSAKAIAAGASLVLGHHSHYYMGVEKKGKSAVAYGLGDFMLDKKHIPEPYREKSTRGNIFHFQIRSHEVVDWSITPCVSDEWGWPSPANAEQARTIIDYFIELSAVLPQKEETLRRFQAQAGQNMLPYAIGLLRRLYKQDGLKAVFDRLSRIRMVDLGVLLTTLYRLLKAKITHKKPS